jgi:hypothetical protein
VQTYVALSRCRTLSGMVLRNPITAQNIIGDPAVARFNEQAQALHPNAAKLELDRNLYRQFLLAELFNFNGLKSRVNGFEELMPGLQTKILSVAEKSARQLSANDPERIKKAAAYFRTALKELAESLHAQIPALIGKSKEGATKADQLLHWVMTRLSLMTHFSEQSFSAAAYILAKKDATTADQPHIYVKALNAKPNERLFDQIMEWCQNQARKENVMPGMILSEKTAAAIAEKLPATLKALSAIKGIGPQKTNLYGPELMLLIRAYQQQLKGPEAEQSSLFL